MKCSDYLNFFLCHTEESLGMRLMLLRFQLVR